MTDPAPRSSRRLEGHTAVVTGASRGIGLAIAQQIVADGGRVVITGRKPEPLAEAVELLGGPSVALGVPGRADDRDHQDAVIATALEAFGSLEHLVNNTGINPSFGNLLDVDDEVARKIMETNNLAALSWVRKAHAAWMGEHGGSIVNVSSLASVAPAPGIGMYAVSKAALTHLTKQLAWELAPSIRVNAVAPAVVKTRFAEALYTPDEQGLANSYPLKRLGEPQDIAAPVAFLLSQEAAWITGQLLVIDGGITLQAGF